MLEVITESMLLPKSCEIQTFCKLQKFSNPQSMFKIGSIIIQFLDTNESDMVAQTMSGGKHLPTAYTSGDTMFDIMH